MYRNISQVFHTYNKVIRSSLLSISFHFLFWI